MTAAKAYGGAASVDRQTFRNVEGVASSSGWVNWRKTSGEDITGKSAKRRHQADAVSALGLVRLTNSRNLRTAGDASPRRQAR